MKRTAAMLLGASLLYSATVHSQSPETVAQINEMGSGSHTDLMNTLLQYNGAIEIIPTDDFSQGHGSLVQASRIEGLIALAQMARTDAHESSWLYFPGCDAWINATEQVGDATATLDTQLLAHGLSVSQRLVVAHTHTDAEYNSYYSRREISDFGPSLYVVPTRQDVQALMHNANMNPGSTIEYIIVSSTGALTMSCRALGYDLNNPYGSRAFADIANVEFTFVLRHLQGTPQERLEQRTAEFRGTVSLAFESIEALSEQNEPKSSPSKR
ncbi:hypothetical protein J4464_03065 [Candidatus Woesearchaeota archaeon]|nr:hypothetical protein [Candidatus Woesearchaeota archaeon]